jgi:UDP-glucuronate 4-epimerase
MKILLTGAAGFIGYHVTRRLLDLGHTVIGIDNLNDYYDVSLKTARLAKLHHANFSFHQTNLADSTAIAALFAQEQFQRVIHLAAQAGVRYSITNPMAYVESNVTGTTNILEGCRHHAIEHLLYASSSSVYGLNSEVPYSTHHNVDHPVSLYAATKKSNELFAHTYSHLFSLPTTGLRFFTVYGPMGRPDMAYFKFTKAILADEAIDVYNHGQLARDFTYIDDIAEAIVRLLDVIPQADPTNDNSDPSSGAAPYRIYNIGNNNPVSLLDFISTLENVIGKKARTNLLPMQAGDVLQTYADISDLQRAIGFAPRTSLHDGLSSFYDWYRSYYTDGTQ